MNLFQALNHTAAFLQRSAHSETELFAVFKTQLLELGLRGSLSLLDAEGKNFVLRAAEYVDLERIEQLSGWKANGFEIPTSVVDRFNPALRAGKAVFLSDHNRAVQSFLPQLVYRLMKSGGLSQVPGVLAPVWMEDRVQGVMHLLGPNLSAQDIPGIESFASHIGVAIINSRLFASLQQAEARYRTMVQNLPVGIYRSTPGARGRFMMANPAFLNLFGFDSEAELEDYTVADLYMDPNERRAFSDQLLAAGSLSGVEFHLRKKDGTPIWGSVTAQVVQAPSDGEGAYFDCVIQDITDHKLAELEVLRRTEELAILHALSLDITAQHSSQELLATIAQRAARLLRAPDSVLSICDPDRQELLACACASSASQAYMGKICKYGEGAAGRVAQTGEALVVNDYAHWAGRIEWVGERGASSAVISAPLTWQGQVSGVLQVIDSSRARQFSQADLELLTLFANQAAIAIENTHLFEQVSVERRHLSLLYDVGRELSTSLDSNEILERAISLTCPALGGVVGEAFLYLPERQCLSLQAVYGGEAIRPGDWRQAVQIPLGEGLAGWVGQESRGVNVPEVDQDPHWVRLNDLEDQVRSALVAPVVRGAQLLGVLSILHPQAGAFSEDHLVLLQAICQQVAFALSNAERYQDVQRRLAESTLIYSLTQAFNQRLDLQTLLDEVAEQLFKRLGYSQVEIFLRQGEQLNLKAYRGLGTQELSQSLNQGIVGRAARSGEVAFVPDVSRDPDYYAGVGDTRAELAVPIFQKDSVVGVINIESDHADQLSVQDRNLLQALAGQISVALENAVLYESMRRYAEDLEATVSRRTAELAELYQLSEEISFKLSYDELLHLLLRHLHAAVKSDFAAGCLRIGERVILSVVSARPLSPAFQVELCATFDRIEEQDRREAQAYRLEDLQVIRAHNYDGAKPVLQALVSKITSPILLEEGPAGVLIAGNDAPGDFNLGQQRLLNIFANQAGAAVERLSALLTAQQKRLEDLVEHLPVGVLLLDSDDNLLVANSQARAILASLQKEPANGRLTHLGKYDLAGLLQVDQGAQTAEIILEGPPSRVFEMQARPVGDQAREKQPRCEPLAVKQQWVLTLREITQERENQVRIQMQERLATVGQMAAGIAHDFNNILAAIMVYTDLLRRDHEMLPANRERLGIIHQQVQYASNLIRQILDFSRRSVMEQSTLDLLPFIKELDRLLVRLLPETIRLELSYQPTVYLLKADPTRLQQVFMNLAVNGRDAMPDGGTLSFRLERYQQGAGTNKPVPDLTPGEWIKIEVSDTGTGIPADILPHLFEPFFTTKPVGQGTGLGLAQAYGIIKQHEGHIEVRSRVGEGTTFTIYLQALPVPEEKAASGEESVTIDGNGRTVLVVEDDLATRQALLALLEEQHYRVLVAADGREALEVYDLSGGGIELVVSDVVMPGLGGIELYQTLSERAADLRMLFISGHPLGSAGQSSLPKGKTVWLSKPFSVGEFNQALQDLLDS